MEVTYYQSLLRKKSSIYNKPEALREFHQKAMTTIAVLNRNMVMMDASFASIFKHYKDISKDNVIKLLIRSRKMYDARIVVRKILLQVLKRKDYFKENIEPILNGERAFEEERDRPVL